MEFMDIAHHQRDTDEEEWIVHETMSRLDSFRQDLIYALGTKQCKEKIPLLFSVETQQKKKECDVAVTLPTTHQQPSTRPSTRVVAIKIAPPEITRAHFSIWETGLTRFGGLRVVSAIGKDSAAIIILPEKYDLVRFSAFSGLEEVPKPESGVFLVTPHYAIDCLSKNSLLEPGTTTPLLSHLFSPSLIKPLLALGEYLHDLQKGESESSSSTSSSNKRDSDFLNQEQGTAHNPIYLQHIHIFICSMNTLSPYMAWID